MPRKRNLTKEEIQAEEIDRQVEEEMKIYREEQYVEEVEKFLNNTLQALCYQYFYGHLKFSYSFDTAKRLIDDSGLPEEKKDKLRHSFASSMVFSRGGVKEEDWDAVMDAINVIQKALRGQN